MSIYLLLYIFTIMSLFIISFLIYKKYNNYYWKYLYFWILIYSIWLIFYLIAFSIAFDINILIYFSRALYFLSITAWYLMIIFAFLIAYKEKIKKISNFNYIIILLLLLLFIISMFSPYIVETMIYDESVWYNYEKFWVWFYIFELLYLISPILFIFLSYKWLKKIKWIKKIRLKNIFIWYSIFIVNYIFFLAILPMLNIWIFQKEQIIFFLPFIFSVFYSTYKYNFLDVKIILWKIINFILPLFISIITLIFLKEYYMSFLDKRLFRFWWINQNFWMFDLILWILIFSLSHYIIKKYILWQSEYYYLSKEITKLKRKIAFISNLDSLNNLLNNDFSKIFKINYVKIELYVDKKWNLNWLKEYFLKDKSYKIFINDVVFIEENKNKFNYKKIENEITNKSYLVFWLINNKKEFIWTFNMWHKLFQDWYTQEEVDLLIDFSEFLVWHLKYIEIYSQINELNINLDKKIDEKTIEYNNLLNKQNDFISFASHEIKSPLWSCIFQLDCLIDDLKEKNIDKEVLENIEWLNKKLSKVWELTKTIFSVQKFDLWKMKLFKQEVDLNFLLEDKIEFHEKSNKNTKFTKDIKNNIWEALIDRIQFEQVIDNLINNAIKFSNKNNPEILVKAYKKENYIYIEIEDNWEWINWEEIEKIFDKYSTWESNSIWLWMWLYLCKKIIELHAWEIWAKKWKKLFWACFYIKLPVN